MFLLAHGATTAASAQVKSFEAPVIVAPDVATPVEPSLSHSSEIDSAVASPDAGQAPSSLAELVSTWKVDALDDEARCLATAVFFESRSESLEGQLAVANVVIGRARSGRFADSLCGVIKQPGQFGFVRSGGRMPTPTDGAQWRTAQAIAQIALNEGWRNPAEGALYFHATHRATDWGRPMVTRIGGHIFYR
ncbi:MAG: cell wall hydrolase [Sphingobium sp.]|nr:cell wall hydrolase [Sphingobium sp.]